MNINSNFINSKSLILSDICIVGSGPAGITIAQDFLNTNLSVTILESGNLNFNLNSQNFNSGITENLGNYPNKDYSLMQARVRAVGGSSSVWAGWSGPLLKEDFQKKDWIDFSGWPIGLGELKRYYKEAQKILNLSKYEYSEKIFDDYKTNTNFKIKNMDHAFWQFSDPPVNFKKKYINQISNSKNINLLYNATVTDLIAYEDRVSELIFHNELNKKIKIKASYYVLCCGGIENASLLLNCAKKNNIFKNQNIGKYFMEHPHVTIGYGYTENKNFLNLYKKQEIKKYNNIKFLTGVYLKKDFRKKKKISNCINIFVDYNFLEIKSAVILRYNFSLKYFHFSYIKFLIQVFKDTSLILNTFFEALRNLFFSKKKFYIVSRLDQCPKPNSKIGLSKSKNIYGNYLPHLKWKLCKKDILTLKKNFSELQKNLKFQGISELKGLNLIKKYNNKKTIENLKFKEKVFGVGHHMGTTRMGKDIRYSVVDKNLLFHKLKNLYCAGSSVFPTGGFINPTLTIVALSLRLSNHLKIIKK